MKNALGRGTTCYIIKETGLYNSFGQCQACQSLFSDSKRGHITEVGVPKLIPVEMLVRHASFCRKAIGARGDATLHGKTSTGHLGLGAQLTNMTAGVYLILLPCLLSTQARKLGACVRILRKWMYLTLRWNITRTSLSIEAYFRGSESARLHMIPDRGIGRAFRSTNRPAACLCHACPH